MFSIENNTFIGSKLLEVGQKKYTIIGSNMAVMYVQKLFEIPAKNG